MMKKLILAWTLVLAACASAAFAQAGGLNKFGGFPDDEADSGSAFNDSRDRVRVKVQAADDKVAPGTDLPVAIIFDIDEGWKIWTDDRAVPAGAARFEYAEFTRVTVNGLPAGSSTAGAGARSLRPTPGVKLNLPYFVWPEAHTQKIDAGEGPKDYLVFHGKAVAYLPLTIATDAPLGRVELPITINFQSCSATTCLAPAVVEATISFEIASADAAGAAAELGEAFADFPTDVYPNIHKGAPVPKIIPFDIFGYHFSIDAGGWGGFLLLLLIAAVGGFLLNLTPCVLPVIPIKIMSLSQAAGNPARCFVLGVWTSLGVVAFWLLLAAIIATFAEFTSTNQLFQYPAFTIGVGVVIAIMAVGMCGLFTVRLPQFVYMVNPKHESIGGSFLFGIMTAILSTPCTAPLMGAAAAWAATQSVAVTMSVFAAIGAGMAFPYLVLSAFPKLVDRMPRTGPASELIKQVMGILLLAAAAFFVGSGISGLLASPPNPPTKVHWWFVGGIGVIAGLWLLIRTVQISPRASRRIAFGGVGVLIALISGWIGREMTEKGPIDWVYYTPERFDEARREGRVVVMDFTAEWCATCKFLESTVLNPESVSSQLREELGVTPMKVDLTGNNTVGNALLKATGRRTIPLLVVYAPDGTEIWKSDAYTRDQVLQAIADAKAAKVAIKP